MNCLKSEKPAALLLEASQRRRGLLGVGKVALGMLAAHMSQGWAQGSNNPAADSIAAEEAKALPLPALGSAWPVPSVDVLNGPRLEARQLEGQALLIYWWSSTCPFCALQSPEMEKFWRAHQHLGLQMLAVSVDKTPQQARAYMQKKGYSFPTAWADPGLKRVMPKPRGLPITLWRDKTGRVAMAEKGQMFAEDVEAMARLL